MTTKSPACQAGGALPHHHLITINDAIVTILSVAEQLMCVAHNDVLTPTRIALAGFETALEPKQLVVLPGGHFDAYVKGFDISSAVQLDWFTQHLLAGRPATAGKQA